MSIHKDITDGARWVRVATLICGLACCICALIAVWGTWTAHTPIIITSGLIGAISAGNYLGRTR